MNLFCLILCRLHEGSVALLSDKELDTQVVKMAARSADVEAEVARRKVLRDNNDDNEDECNICKLDVSSRKLAKKRQFTNANVRRACCRSRAASRPRRRGGARAPTGCATPATSARCPRAPSAAAPCSSSTTTTRRSV